MICSCHFLRIRSDFQLLTHIHRFPQRFEGKVTKIMSLHLLQYVFTNFQGTVSISSITWYPTSRNIFNLSVITKRSCSSKISNNFLNIIVAPRVLHYILFMLVTRPIICPSELVNSYPYFWTSVTLSILETSTSGKAFCWFQTSHQSLVNDLIKR